MSDSSLEEQHFRNAVTTILVDHGVIQPLVTIVLDYTLPVWTWDFNRCAMENVSPQSTPQTIVTRSTIVRSHWTSLHSNRPLGVGDCLAFLFDIPDSDQTDFIAFGISDVDDAWKHIEIENKNKTPDIIDVRCVTTNLQPFGSKSRRLGDFKGKVSTVSRIVLSRDDQQIRARVLFRHQNDELEFLLDTPKAQVIVFPKIAFWCILNEIYTSVNWKITIANYLD